MSIFDTFEHFFAHLFPHNPKEAEALLTEISPYVNEAGPVVTAVEQDLKPVLTPEGIERAQTLNRFLAKYIHEEQALEAKVNELVNLSTGDLLRDAAKAILLTMLPPTVPTALLNLVIETAYQLYVVRKAQPKPAPTLTAPVPVPA